MQTTTVRFSSERQPLVTGVIPTDNVARNLDDVFDYYRKKAGEPRAEEEDTPSSGRIRKMMRSLETLYTMSKRISQLMPLDALYKEMRDLLFGVFDKTNTLVFLIHDEQEGDYLPKLIASADGEAAAPILIPQSVFQRALQERVTLVANDAPSDERFSQSDSIVGLSIRSLMCAPLLLGDRVLGALYVDNRERGVVFDKSDAELLTAFAAQAAVAIDNARLCDVLQQSYHQTLQALVNTIEAKDTYTSGHSQRVAYFAEQIGRELRLPDERIKLLRTAAELHDIGKIGVTEMIINKNGKLSDTEFGEIKGHTIKGEAIIRPITYLEPILPAIRSHHEWWNGEGYPDGLSGDLICLEARILAVADAYDAMTTKRAYNQPLTKREARDRIAKGSGTQFDPEVFEAFSRYINRITQSGEDTH
jgi:hypothetical protein